MFDPKNVVPIAVVPQSTKVACHIGGLHPVPPDDTISKLAHSEIFPYAQC
jgi:hypothetical protein